MQNPHSDIAIHNFTNGKQQANRKGLK